NEDEPRHGRPGARDLVHRRARRSISQAQPEPRRPRRTRDGLPDGRAPLRSRGLPRRCAARLARPGHRAPPLRRRIVREPQRAVLASYPEFVRSAVFTAPQLVGTVTGGVRGTPLVTRVTLTIVPVAGRLAVIRRETE